MPDARPQLRHCRCVAAYRLSKKKFAYRVVLAIMQKKLAFPSCLRGAFLMIYRCHMWFLWNCALVYNARHPISECPCYRMGGHLQYQPSTVDDRLPHAIWNQCSDEKFAIQNHATTVWNKFAFPTFWKSRIFIDAWVLSHWPSQWVGVLSMSWQENDFLSLSHSLSLVGPEAFVALTYNAL